jgi:alkanesulfonate monooxygenase SsuD/methylene tetrahydromethanopterin reductase-like flavin-dependent oxidoreductase (luciferase family)
VIGIRVRVDMFAWQVVPWPVMRDDVRFLETLDIGTVWPGDEFAMPPPSGGSVLEAWTTLAALATCTARVRLGILVSDVALRHPAMLAKQAATVDCLSDGRLDLGIGPGDNRRVKTGWLGIGALTPGGHVDRLREAAEVLDRLLRERQLTFHGEYFKLDEAPLAPPPVQHPRPPLIIAAEGKNALRVVAERADVWVSGAWGSSFEEALKGYRERNRLLDEHCSAINRDPKTIERACLVGWGSAAPFVSSDAFQEFIGRYRDVGVQRFVFSFGSDAAPPPYADWTAAGVWVSRPVLDAWAAQAIADMRGPIERRLSNVQ